MAGNVDARHLDGVLAIEAPPFGTELVQSGSALKQARLSESREWFVQTPIEIELNEGVVVGASLDLPNLEGDRNQP